jgi:hypothetical protein
MHRATLFLDKRQRRQIFIQGFYMIAKCGFGCINQPTTHGTLNYILTQFYMKIMHYYEVFLLYRSFVSGTSRIIFMLRN